MMNPMPEIISDMLADDVLSKQIAECSNMDELKKLLCKTCRTMKRRTKAEALAAYAKQYYQMNKELISEKNRIRYQDAELREALVAKHKEYASTERGREALRAANRRARAKRREKLKEEKRKQEQMSESTNSGSSSSSAGSRSDNDKSN